MGGVVFDCFRETTRFISYGLSTFAKENGLQVEDVCVFELIKRNNNRIVVLEVSIFRN